MSGKLPPGGHEAVDALEIIEQPLEPLPLFGPSTPELGRSTEPSPQEQLDAVGMAVEIWRLGARLKRVAPLLPSKELRPLESSVAKLGEFLERAGLSTDDPEGRSYTEGEQLEVLLFEQSPGLTRPTVLQTVKPAIYRRGILIGRAEVVVGVPPAADAGP